MPRSDVVLTGLIAFGAGVAVGANWGKLRKRIGPLLENLGLQMADLGDILSASDLNMEDFAPQMKSAQQAKTRRPRASRRGQVRAVPAGEAFVPAASRPQGKHVKFPAVRPTPKTKPSRRQRIVAREEEAPLATGTFGN